LTLRQLNGAAAAPAAPAVMMLLIHLGVGVWALAKLQHYIKSQVALCVAL
jgi:hypothetical protein